MISDQISEQPGAAGSDESKRPLTKRLAQADEDPGWAMLYHTMKEGENAPIGYMASIKLNGWWARWSQGKLYSRNGKFICEWPIPFPSSVDTDGLQLVGELYSPVSMNDVVETSTTHHRHPNVDFYVFDWIEYTKPFVERYKHLTVLHKSIPRAKTFKLVHHEEIKSEADFTNLQREVIEQKHEGLVLRHPDGKFVSGSRVRTTLKWKPYEKVSAEVVSVKTNKTGVRIDVIDKVANGPYGVNVPNPGREFKIGDRVDICFSGRDSRTNKPELASVIQPGKFTRCR